MGKKIKKYYAVKNGRNPGIYNSWNECKAQVDKFKNAVFKSFMSLEEAEEFMNKSKKDEKSKNSSYAYIDGSFNEMTKVYGYGGFIMHNEKKYIIKGSGNDKELAKMRNVAGEIIACQEAVKKAIELGIKNIDIFYDYSGIERWATGEWKRNRQGTKKYYEYMQSIKSIIEVNFKKVEGHSGDAGNDEADKIAKEAVGIIDTDSYKNNNQNKSEKIENIEELTKDKDENNNNQNKKIERKKLLSILEKKYYKKNEIRKKISTKFIKRIKTKYFPKKKFVKKFEKSN